MSRTQGILSISGNFEPNIAAPIDARGVVQTKADLSTNGTFGVYYYIGMVVSVTSDTTPANNGQYILNAVPPTVADNWSKTGSSLHASLTDTATSGHPISAITDLQTALNAKAPLDSPTFTGTVGGITASMVGLENVSNTSDANKPVSTATQAALDGKASSGVRVVSGATALETLPTTHGVTIYNTSIAIAVTLPTPTFDFVCNLKNVSAFPATVTVNTSPVAINKGQTMLLSYDLGTTTWIYTVISDIVDSGIASMALASGDFAMLNSAGTLAKATATADFTANRIVGRVIIGGDAASTVTFLRKGNYTSTSHGLTIGAPLYLTTLGVLSTTQPAAGNTVIMMGYATSANNIYLEISPNTIKLL